MTQSTEPATTDADLEAIFTRIRNAVLDACLGYTGGDPHATTWGRGGYRNNVPTLCDTCGTLIVELQLGVAECVGRP